MENSTTNTVNYKHSKIYERAGTDKAVCALAALCAAVFAVMAIDSAQDWGGDWAEYISQAIAICKGTVAQYMADNTFIIDKTGGCLGPYAYPWLFPLMLVPFYAIFGKNLIAFKVPGILGFMLFAIYFYRLLRREFGKRASLFTVICFICAKSIFGMVNRFSADTVFLGVSTAALYYIIALFETKDKSKQIKCSILTGIFIFCASNIRTNGIILLCTLLCMRALCLASKNKKLDNLLQHLGVERTAPLYLLPQMLPYIIFIAGTILMSIALPIPAKNHVSVLSQVTVHSMLYNVRYYAFLGKKFFPFGTETSAALYGIFALFIAYGLLRHAVRTAAARASFIYTAGTLAIYIIWPYRQSLRFILPVLPLYALFAAEGIRDIAAFLPHKDRMAMAAAGMLLFLLGFRLPHGEIVTGVRARYGSQTDETQSVYKYIKENTKTSDIIMFYKPRVLYLETGRLGFDNDNIGRLCDADYLLLSRDGYGTFNYDIEAQYPNESKILEKVLEYNTIKLYKITK